MPRKGENIYKRKDGRWEARFIQCYENGKAKYRSIYGKTYAEVRAKRLEELSMPENTKIPASKRLATFETLANLWLADVKVSVKESSYTRYYRIIEKYLFPLLKNQILAKIDQTFIRQLSEKLLKEGGVDKGPLSPKTVSDILCVLKRIFQYGSENNYPCPNLNSIKYPQKSQKNIKILNDTDRTKIEKILLNSEDATSLGILFTMFTGVRIGELCGLRWEDIDLENGTVTISRTVERISDLNVNRKTKTKVVISEPKTQNSIRVIPLTKFLIEYLSSRQKPDDYYLITGTRHYTEPHQYYIRYQKFLERHEIDAHTFHALRHTFATRCVEMGFDAKSLAEILGHTDIQTTLSIYVHPTLQQKRVQMDRLVPAT